MPTLLDFRRRIRSVKNTQQITRAMKFVAAARLRRAQEAAIAARPFARELARVLRSTMARIEEPQRPLLAHRDEQNVLAIVLTGERGLAGAFNSNILRKANEFLRANKGKKLSTITVGKKGRDALKKAGFNIVAEYVNVLARVDFGTAREIASLVTDLYAGEKIDSVYIIFSEFKTVMTPNLVVEKLLPVEAIRAEEETPAEQVTEKYPRSDKFGIVAQVRRSAVSVTANIAEGFGRGTTKELLRSLQIARGELEETRSFMLLSRDLGRISKEEFYGVNAHCDSAGQLINALGRKLR